MVELDLANLYTRHRQGLFTLALSITRCRARAEDAVHEAFARLCARRAIAIDDATAYVFAAVRAAAIDQCRRAKFSGVAAPEKESIYATDTPATQAVDAERIESVIGALDALPDASREVVVMKIYAGLSFAQISGILGQPLQTVASRYRRSLRALRVQLEKLV